MSYTNDCLSCKKTAHCCIFREGEFAFVGLEDARRIKKKTGKDYDSFLDYSPLSKKIISGLKKDDMSLEGYLRFKQLDSEGRILRMKSLKNGRCIFLDEKNRCSIYDIRPNICRIYPFWAMKLTNGRTKVITHDPEPDCTITKDLLLQKDIENILSKEEIFEFKKIFAKINKEDKIYRKNIKSFVKENGICRKGILL